jgi:general secretion pathway protein E
MSAAAEATKSVEQNLIDHLRQSGKLDGEGAARAWRVFEHTRVSLTKILLELGLVPERDLVAAFADGLGITLADESEYPLEPVLPDAVTSRFLMDAKAVLLSATDDTVTIAAHDPLDRFVVDAVGLATNRRVIVKAAAATDIEEALRRLYTSGDADTLAAAAESAQGATEADVARLRESASEAPVIRFVSRRLRHSHRAAGTAPAYSHAHRRRT